MGICMENMPKYICLGLKGKKGKAIKTLCRKTKVIVEEVRVSRERGIHTRKGGSKTETQ